MSKPEIVLKAALAEVTSITSENPNGEFHVILSTSSLDRDGETIEPGAFDPLPDHITFDIDHGLSVRSVVGSGKPFYADEARTRVEVKGTFASTPLAQDTRALVTEGHIRTTSVAMKATKTKAADGSTSIPKAELYNGSFVAIPANREALVLSSKSADVKAGARHSSADLDYIQSAHDAMVSLGASCDGMKHAARAETKDAHPETAETPVVVEDPAPVTPDEHDEVVAADAAADAAKAASVTAEAAEATETARARIAAHRAAFGA